MSKEEFKMVGVDGDGNPLYQKIVREPLSEEQIIDVSGDQTEVSVADSVRSKSTVERILDKTQSKQRGASVKNSDFLYADMDPALIKLRHEQSQAQFPNIKLLEKEFVLKVVRRHPIGIVVIWLLTTFVATLLIGVWMMLLAQNSSAITTHNTLLSMEMGVIIIGSIATIAVMFAVIFTRVYRANMLIVTTERVVQVISNSLFDIKTQTIDLSWIEDVSHHQKGFFAMTIDYGSIRLSTIGEETTYYFVLTPNPQAVSTWINDIVFAVKNEYALTDRELKD